MKISAIVNAMNTYYSYQNKIRNYWEEWKVCDGFEDEIGKQEWKTKIDETQIELGNFLNIEV